MLPKAGPQQATSCLTMLPPITLDTILATMLPAHPWQALFAGVMHSFSSSLVKGTGLLIVISSYAHSTWGDTFSPRAAFSVFSAMRFKSSTRTSFPLIPAWKLSVAGRSSTS